MLSIPDSSTDRRLIVLEVQPGQYEVPDGDRDGEFYRLSPVGPDLEHAVSVPLGDAFDGSDGPPFDVVCRFSCVDSIVSHWS